jgi:hypothetical protein
MTALVAAILPFALAILFLALSPLFGARAKRYVMGQINRDAQLAGRNPGDNPAEVALGNIEDYVDFAADSVQVWPLALLPITGAVFAITGRIASQVALTILVGTVIITVVLDVWMLTRAPQEYASRKFKGLTIAPWVGIVGNAASIALLVIFR